MPVKYQGCPGLRKGRKGRRDALPSPTLGCVFVEIEHPPPNHLQVVKIFGLLLLSKEGVQDLPLQLKGRVVGKVLQEFP